MDMTRDKMELLAPAGSPESLKAAVATGADAVYLGIDEFNARARAVNFRMDNLKEHISFCHNRGVKVYVTLNILLYDDEVERAFEAACGIRNCGADALIIQDMGLLRLLREAVPDLPLHASTQVGISSPSGAQRMKNAGFERVILAREMSLEQITKASNLGLGTEVFVHGARCYSYSGQCLMSAMLGGRSGNRGFCAQPCRLPYSLYDESGDLLSKGHLLSLKDTMYLSELGALRNAGVTALKIEGRMKGPEYVAAVTSIYRKYLDMDNPTEIDKADKDDLLKAFNREGFSKGALSNNPGFDEFASTTPSDSGFPVGTVIKGGILGSYSLLSESVSRDDGLRIGTNGGFAERDIEAGKKAVIPIEGKTGDIIYRTRDNANAEKYRLGNSLSKLLPVAISAHAVFRKNLNPTMKVIDDKGNTFEYSIDTFVEEASAGGTSPDRIRKQLLKSGSTDFEISRLDLDCDEGIYIRISDVNELRRKALEGLYEKRAAIPTPVKCKMPVTSSGKHHVSEPELTLLMYSVPADFDPSGTALKRIYADSESCREDLESIRNICIENHIGFFIHIPYSSENIPDMGCDGYLIENPGLLEKLPIEKTVLGSGFNITNSYALDFHAGVMGATLSNEMSMDRITALDNLADIPLETTVYGNIRVMESPYCPARDICKGSLCSDKHLVLKDRKDETWPVVYNKHKHSVRIFNPHKLMVFDRKNDFINAGIKFLRLIVTDESNDEIIRLLRYASEGRVPHMRKDVRYTKGFY